ncbi:hypothetical protein IAF11_12170, partial [Acinetobacter baumannii]|nr:hypothetical protein [Acinetobacter baumannii]
DADYLNNLEQKRNDSAKKKKDGYIDVNMDLKHATKLARYNQRNEQVNLKLDLK